MTVAHPLNSRMYADRFGHPEMAAIFDERAVQQRRLRVESALARAEADEGLIPEAAAVAIAERANVADVSLERIAAHYDETQNDIVALVRALGERLDPESREVVHFGATSQDVHITAMALALREAVDWFAVSLTNAEGVIAELALRERSTLMAGRTHGQHAAPITFGYKVAAWAVAAREHRIRLEQLRPRLLVGSLKGAVGTHAALGASGPAIERRMMEALGLAVSPINIQPSEERYVEYLNWLAMLATTIARVASEIRGLHRTEVAEVHEWFDEGHQVGSSTMPHKRNPEWSETAQGVAYVVQAHSTGMGRVLQEHERDATRNGPEHLLLAEASILAANLVAGMTETLRRLEVDREQMRRNLDLNGGLIASEAVMFALAAKTGQKETAHHAVYLAAHRAYREQRSFRDVLLEDEWIRSHLSRAELVEVMAPESHVGTCTAQVDEVLALLVQPLLP